MASNDPEPIDEPIYPTNGPVAFLTRLVHVPAINDQTWLRIICVLILAAVLSYTPWPWQLLGFVTLIVLALSLGRITPIK